MTKALNAKDGAASDKQKKQLAAVLGKNDKGKEVKAFAGVGSDDEEEGMLEKIKGLNMNITFQAHMQHAHAHAHAHAYMHSMHNSSAHANMHTCTHAHAHAHMRCAWPVHGLCSVPAAQHACKMRAACVQRTYPPPLRSGCG